MKKFNQVPEAESPRKNENLKNGLVKQDYLVQEYHELCVIRLSVCRTKRQGTRWVDGIIWDEMQSIKSGVGYGNKFAVECFPEDKHVVNVANMRHLFIIPNRST